MQLEYAQIKCRNMDEKQPKYTELQGSGRPNPQVGMRYPHMVPPPVSVCVRGVGFGVPTGVCRGTRVIYTHVCTDMYTGI